MVLLPAPPCPTFNPWASLLYFLQCHLSYFFVAKLPQKFFFRTTLPAKASFLVLHCLLDSS